MEQMHCHSNDMKERHAEYIIEACEGKAFSISEGDYVTVIDVNGGQVADFFAVNANDGGEFLSTAVTIDCHESIRLNVGDHIYSNLYRPMFKIIYDEVGEHDMLFPCCRREMYDFFYHNGAGHPNCFDNINQSLGEHRPIIQPVNLLMHTTINDHGKITIHPPSSKAGGKIVLQALMDVRLGIASCSVSEGDCNSKHCSPIKVVIQNAR